MIPAPNTETSGLAGSSGLADDVADPETAVGDGDSESDEHRDTSDGAAVTPRRPGIARVMLLLVVFICAACGLVYELALVTLGSYLLGNTASQASIVLSVMVFAMGVGSLLAKRLRRDSVLAFAVIELLLAAFGGLSVLGLYYAFAFLEQYTPALIATAFVLGVLIGAEMPLLMEMLQRIRRQDAGEAVADLFATDYIGALVGGLAFPFLLLPVFGQIKGAIVVGIVNALAAVVIALSLFAKSLSRGGRAGLAGASLLVVALLVACFMLSDRFEATARQVMYRDPIAYSEQSQYQEIVVTETLVGPQDIRLYLNGDLQFSSTDEYRYHESLVHPAMAGPRSSVLVLGGGDGLALREIVKYQDVEQVTLVELDPAMTKIARTMPELAELNDHAFDDPRVDIVNADAFSWLRTHVAQYDVIIVDMPDPDETATAKLYSVEFYSMVRAHLSNGGRVSIQSGSPYFAPKSFWCISATLKDAGLAVEPYHVDVPSFGNWGFHLGAVGSVPDLHLDPPGYLQFLTPEVLDAAAVFPADRGPRSMPVSTLMDPVILEYAQQEWANY